MWCCFDAITVIEPKKINAVPKRLTAEVPVTVKPVTLMFRIPSQDEEKVKEKEKEKVEVKEKEKAEIQETVDDCSEDQEICSVDSNVGYCNTPFTIIYSLSIMALLYLLILETENRDL